MNDVGPEERSECNGGIGEDSEMGGVVDDLVRRYQLEDGCNKSYPLDFSPTGDCSSSPGFWCLPLHATDIQPGTWNTMNGIVDAWG